jgi:hypothetical protein
MKTLLKVCLFVFAAQFFLTSCDAVVEGNGIFSTENRETENFTSIEVSNHFSIVLHKSDKAYVQIEADQNLIPLIQTETEDACLRIYHKGIIKSNRDILIRIGYTQLNEIDISGAVELFSEDTLYSEKFEIIMSGATAATIYLQCRMAEIDVSGASDLTVNGSGTEALINQTGASVIRAYGFLAKDVNVRSSGSSQAEIHAISYLQIKASGASGISYCGNPVLKKNISTAASVKKSDACD